MIGPFVTKPIVSQIVLLLARTRVLVEMPLDVTVLVVQGPASYLERPHAHPGANLAELAGIVRSADEHMVPHLDDVVDVLEGDNPATLRFVLS